MNPGTEEDAALAWSRLDGAARRSLELAFSALVSNGLAVGSVLVDGDGTIVAQGRNRAYDAGGGDDLLQGTPLAHAELNVLAAVATGLDLSRHTLWSTLKPCSMCDAALAFTGVGRIRWLAPDPSATTAEPDAERELPGPIRIGPDDDRWLIVASLLFLASVVRRRGLKNPMVLRNARLEPETNVLLNEIIVARQSAVRTWSLSELLFRNWAAVLDAARARRARRTHG